MSDIEWQNPPTGRSTWAPIAAELRANPGRWACIKKATTDAALSTRIKQGHSVWSPAGSFESRMVRVVDPSGEGKRLFDIYARFVGEVTA